MDQQAHILFVDDEQMLHALFQRLFSRHGLTVTCCSNGVQAVEKLKEESFDLVVTDFMMPDMDGTQLLSHIRQEYPHLKVIMITAHANVQQAVRVMKTGAIDYIPKPFSTTELLERVQKCLDEPVEQPAPKSAAPKRQKKTAASDSSAYIGEHASLQELRNLLPLLSANDAPVFIQGESGTGKEVLSKQIHHMSKRSGGPFVAINCANLPRELVESHLFGHRKGAFTGAIEDMTGAFERANGGTLLLDEITEVEMGVQAKLLRVLQEREFHKVGSPTPQKADVRIIATSNRNLGEAIAEGIFREDLYHRLCVFPLTVPPLRERVSDVPLLVDHFIDKYCTLYGLPPKTISADLLRQFQLNSWPGNVRQLENMVQRGVLISADRETILPEDVVNDFFADADLHTQPRAKEGSVNLQTIDDMERHMILQALDDTGN
ncbi:MAG: sigma-54-dependent transcriptional regulator, partial [Rhodothermales bacterium]